jgi:hypothetical protein
MRKQLVGRRLDSYLRARYPRLSRTSIQKLIKQGDITVNGLPTKPSYEPNAGDLVEGYEDDYSSLTRAVSFIHVQHCIGLAFSGSRSAGNVDKSTLRGWRLTKASARSLKAILMAMHRPASGIRASMTEGYRPALTGQRITPTLMSSSEHMCMAPLPNAAGYCLLRAPSIRDR